MASPSFPILIIAPPDPSEAVLFSGLVARLVHEIPGARFTVLGDPAVTPLYRDLPGLEAVLDLETAALGLHWPLLWNRLRGRRLGLVLDLAGTPLGRSLPAKRHAVRRPLPGSLGAVHKVIEAARILKIEDEPPAPMLFTSPATEAAAEGMLGASSGPILALAPSADWVGKTWPAERYAIAAAELLGPKGSLAGGRLMIVGGAQERWANEAVRRAMPRDRLIDLTAKADLLTTYACLKRARLFIGNDNLMMHLASAAGAPTIGLFGPSDDRVWGPWGERGLALRGPRDLEAIRAADPGLNQAVCHMQDLPVAWVVNAAGRLLAATEAPRAPSPLVDGADAPESPDA
jgi:ADP-heptose:LPS heptosyltransferase